MSTQQTIMESNDAILEIKLKREFQKAAKDIGPAALAPLKEVIAENGGTYMQAHEILSDFNGAFKKASKDELAELSWSERMQMKFVSWVMGKIGSVAEKHVKEEDAEEVYARVSDDNKEQLKQALQTDTRVQGIVLEIS